MELLALLLLMVVVAAVFVWRANSQLDHRARIEDPRPEVDRRPRRGEADERVERETVDGQQVVERIEAKYAR